MTARVWRSVDEMARYGDLDDDDEDTFDDVAFDDVTGELHAGERIGGPPVNVRGRAARRGGLALALTLGGGWVALNHPEVALGWLPDISWPKLETKTTEIKPNDLATATEQPLVQPLTLVDVAATPGVDPAAEPTPPASPMAAGKSALETALGRAAGEHADAFATRAAEAGLHPDLSRVLLTKLTPTDYRNAAFAIKTALAETPDSGVFTYPRERKGDAALFEVRFVPGAETGCRRYVVEVTKDRWLTTALPVQKCGLAVKASVAQ